MSSRRNSFKTHLEFSSNSTTQNNKLNSSADTLDKSINLNEFLDFLNLSCHVNDMISQNSEENQRQNKEHIQTTKSSGATGSSDGGNRSKVCGIQSSIDFQKLSQNRLVNDLYGFNQNLRTQADDLNDNNAGSGSDTARALKLTSKSFAATKTKSANNNEGNLHPKLNEKLDYVLNEGILDAVLPFICPVPLPPNYTSRLKLKQRDTKDLKATTITAQAASVCEDTNDHEGSGISKECIPKVKGKASLSHIKSTTMSSASKKE